jgi:hypothetical protein
LFDFFVIVVLKFDDFVSGPSGLSKRGLYYKIGVVGLMSWINYSSFSLEESKRLGEFPISKNS